MNKNKKVMLISPIPPPVGGIASWTINILNYLDKRNIKENFIHLNSAMKFRRITSTSLVSRIFYGIINTILFYFQFIYSLIKFNPKICHFTSSASYGLFKDILLLLTSKLLFCENIIHYRFGRIPELYESRNWEWKLLMIVNKLTHKIIVLDKKSYDILIRYNSNVYILENPMPEILEGYQKNNLCKEEFLLFVGHVTKAKGIYDLFNALSEINININIKIVGPYEEKVKNELLKIYNKNVSFYGSLNKKEVFKLMDSCKIFVLPSHTEGFPNVILEAMSIGCSIISTNVGAVPDMLSNDRGYVVRVKNTNKLSEAIYTIYSNEDLREKYAINAYNFAQNNYLLKDIINKMFKIWYANNTK